MGDIGMTTIVVAVVVAVVALIIGSLLGWNRRKSVAEKEISSAEEEATRIINEAIKGAENKKREAMVEAKEDILKQRSEYEKEVKERRGPAEAGAPAAAKRGKSRPQNRCDREEGRTADPEACTAGRGKGRDPVHQAQPDGTARTHFRPDCRRGQGLPHLPGGG